MRKNKLFTRGDPKGLSHPLEPVVTSFSLIALLTGGYKIGCKSWSAITARTDMIKSEFIRFIS
jgi:hypothetical protein